MKIYHKKINAETVDNLFVRLTAFCSQKSKAVIFGGNASSRFSYWSFEPKDNFEIYASGENPLEKLQEFLNIKIDKPKNLPDGIFVGGYAGFFCYELGRFIEDVGEKTVDDIGLPLISLGLYDKIIAYDSNDKYLYLISCSNDGLNELEEVLKLAVNLELPKYIFNDNNNSISGGYIEKLNSNMNRTDYEKAFKQIKQYIYDGDVYQINFSQRFSQPFIGRAVNVFNWHNRYNPCPYSAFIDGGDFQIVSSSPELFIQKTGDAIITKPIKGTRPRRPGDKQFNQAKFIDLAQSEKDQAELNMIIDLERNDLGRICRAGTIKVIQPRTIEEYPTVFHGVATIEGLLKPKTAFCEILRAMFPGGSITGAPKVRAMQIIDKLEPTARGIYTGSIGFIGFDGTICLNIAIRTVIIKNKTAYMQTGGGIVADSDVAQEWNETIVKAQALAMSVIKA